MKCFKQRLIDCSMQDWRSKLEESGKARHYRFIAPTLQVANCINYNLPIKFRISLSKLRCSVHSLNVEVGRHNNVEYNQRLCIICDTREVEDEFHFVMKCPAYNNLRRIHLPYVNEDQCTVDDFHSMFNGSRNEVLALSKFIYYAFRLREERIKEL